MCDLEQVLNLCLHQCIFWTIATITVFTSPQEASTVASENPPVPEPENQLLMHNLLLFLACLSRQAPFIQLHLTRNGFLLGTTEGEQ